MSSTLKNDCESSPKSDSGNNTLNSNQSLFMDESSEDLENYLNTPLTKSSSGTGDKLSYSEMNSLSINIKARFETSSTDSKKNKFFKSKSAGEKNLVNSSEIPVINEAMKKILKESPYKPPVKHSPKALKTYSNKHKDKPPVVESFALPDEPFVSLDTSQNTELDSINLNMKLEEDGYDDSFVFDSSLVPNPAKSLAINISGDFRRKSSTGGNMSYGEGDLETEVREGFNFEEDSLVESSNVMISAETNRSPVVCLKPFNLNDVQLFRANDLSLQKNRKQLLIERWQKFNSKLNLSDNKKILKVKPQKSSKFIECVTSKPNSRRNTRSNTSSIDSQDSSNTLSTSASHSGELQLDIGKDCRSFELIHNTFGNDEKSAEELICSDILSPRRYTRRSGVDSRPVSSSNGMCSLSGEKTEELKKDDPKVSPSKEFRSNKRRKNNKTANNPTENISTPPSSNIRISLRSSNSSSKLINNKKISKREITTDKNSQSEPAQKADTPSRTSTRLKMNSEENSENPLGPTNTEVEPFDGIKKIDVDLNTSIERIASGVIQDSNGTVKKRRGRSSKITSEKEEVNQKSNNEKIDNEVLLKSIETSEGNKNVGICGVNDDTSHNCGTREEQIIENYIEKKSQLEFKSDKNLGNPLGPTNTKVAEIIFTSHENEKIDVDAVPDSHDKVRDRRGRFSKRSLENTSDLLKPSENEKVDQKSNKATDKIENDISFKSMKTPAEKEDMEINGRDGIKKSDIQHKIESNIKDIVDASYNCEPQVEQISFFEMKSPRLKLKSDENSGKTLGLTNSKVGEIRFTSNENKQIGPGRKRRGRSSKKMEKTSEVLKSSENEDVIQKSKEAKDNFENEISLEFIKTSQENEINGINDVKKSDIQPEIASNTKDIVDTSHNCKPKVVQISFFEKNNGMKSPRLQLNSDDNLGNRLGNTKVAEIPVTSNKNEKIDVNLNTSIDKIPRVFQDSPVKKRRGRPSKKMISALGNTSEVLKPSENEEMNHKLNEPTEENETIRSYSKNNATKSSPLKCEKPNNTSVISRNSDFSVLGNETQNKEGNIKKIIQSTTKDRADFSHNTGFEVVEKNTKMIENNKSIIEKKLISHRNNHGPSKRKRGRPSKKRMRLDQNGTTAENSIHAISNLGKSSDDKNKIISSKRIQYNNIKNYVEEVQTREENIETNSKNETKDFELSSSENGDSVEAKFMDSKFGDQRISDETVERTNGKRKKMNNGCKEYIENFQKGYSLVEENKIFDDKDSNVDSYRKKFTKKEESLDNKIKLGGEFKVYRETEDICLENEFKSYNANGDINYVVFDEKEDKPTSGYSEICKTSTVVENTNITKNNIEIKETRDSNVAYSDFGVDINRRTSFRKILERVMEASRLEMEMTKSEAFRTQRSKSVPHEQFHDEEISLKAFSADSKLKYLKEKRNENGNIRNIEFSRAKKCLDFNLPSEFSFRKRTKSMYVVDANSSDDRIYQRIENGKFLKEMRSTSEPIQSEDELVEGRDLKNSVNGVEMKETDGVDATITTANEIIPESKGFTNDTTEKSQGEALDGESSSKSGSKNASNSKKTDDTDSEGNISDLEVENLLLGKELNELYERKRSKSFTAGSRTNTISRLSGSAMGRRFKKKNRKSGITGQATEASIPKPVKKVYEFNAGDSVWGKVGNYPYWPGLIIEDPETSDFKKFRLLRTKPYYHVRFFGDNGKRAWTTYCIPYDGPDDLEKFREESFNDGIQSNEFVVKTHMVKWTKAVEEAEMVRNYSLEKKLGYFRNILPRKEESQPSEFEEDIPKLHVERVRSKSFSCTRNTPKSNILQREKIPMKVSSLLSCIDSVVKNYSLESEAAVLSPQIKTSPIKNSSGNLDKTDTEPKNIPTPSRKRSIPMKDSSVLTCIDDVVKKYCSEHAHSPPEVSAIRKNKQSSRKIKEVDSNVDMGLELLNISTPDVTSMMSEKNDLNSPATNSFKQSTTSSTPLSSRKDIRTSPKRTRSKSSLRLEKRRLSIEFKHDVEEISEDPKAKTELKCSPRRMKLKRRTIEIGQTNLEIPTNENILLNDCVNRLSEFKKNLFRGVTKEKVCQICEKSGEVFKCRGPCNGDFHIKCIENSLKETEQLTLEGTKELEDKFVANKELVEISTVVSRDKFSDNVILSPINKKIPIIEQLDRKMKELMTQVESRVCIESTDSSSEESERTEVVKKTNGKSSKKNKGSFKHVTADDVCLISLSDVDALKHKSLSENLENLNSVDEGVYKCPYCISTVIPPCFVCNSIVSKKGNTMRQRCSLHKCGRYYHLECLNVWHQTQWSFILHEKRKTEAFDSFVCPRHSCHICVSENLGVSMGRCPNDKLVKCLRCPATYHNSYHCVPAGSDILTSTQIVCPRHVEGNKKSNTLNTIWCFVCSEGGNLICCETCPTSVHAECLPVNLLEDDTYICEDCESGRFPLYDEVVWVKCGTFRWWPAIILFPSEVPSNVESKPHSKGEFVVKFFGTYNYFWVGRGRAFLYQEGDTGYLNNTKNKIDEAFSRAIREAADVYRLKKGLRAKKQKEVNTGLKPPTYVRIKVNRPVGNVKVFEGNLSNTTPCDCDPRDKSPCGPNSNCLNRILCTECNPEICPAGQKCKNQCFEKREYPQVIPYRTTGRGWGLKTLEPIKKGRFVIEYVGEIIDDEEYQRRITRMHQQKDENYYFLTIDNNRMLDAGPKGNVARFMNHSCQPNCETQKWTVNGDTRVGLFAMEDIPVDGELTFNYNLECVGTEKKICRCGASNCSGFIGLKPEDQKPLKKNSAVKTVEHEKQEDIADKDLCFICNRVGDVFKCSSKMCSKSYHLECVQLDSKPNGKWSCPAHSCTICSKRTARICVLCNNSYCPYHSDGNIRHDNSLGFLCTEHDQTRIKTRRRTTISNGNKEASSSDSLGTPQKKTLLGGAKSESLRSERYRKRTSGFEIENPSKKIKLDE